MTAYIIFLNDAPSCVVIEDANLAQAVLHEKKEAHRIHCVHTMGLDEDIWQARHYWHIHDVPLVNQIQDS